MLLGDERTLGQVVARLAAVSVGEAQPFQLIRRLLKHIDVAAQHNAVVFRVKRAAIAAREKASITDQVSNTARCFEFLACNGRYVGELLANRVT